MSLFIWAIQLAAAEAAAQSEEEMDVDAAAPAENLGEKCPHPDHKNGKTMDDTAMDAIIADLKDSQVSHLFQCRGGGSFFLKGLILDILFVSTSPVFNRLIAFRFPPPQLAVDNVRNLPHLSCPSPQPGGVDLTTTKVKVKAPFLMNPAYPLREYRPGAGLHD